MKPESGPMEGDYLWREFLMYWHELTFGAFKLIKINQESGEKIPALGPALHATTGSTDPPPRVPQSPHGPPGQKNRAVKRSQSSRTSQNM